MTQVKCNNNKTHINVTLMHVCASIVTVEEQGVLHILSVYVCSLSYSACAILYCRLWPARLYHVFSSLSHTWHNILKKLLNRKCMF